MSGSSTQFIASGSAGGKNHLVMKNFVTRSIGLRSCSCCLIFLILTASFQYSLGTATNLSPDNGEEVSSSNDGNAVNMLSIRGYPSEFEFERVKRPFFQSSSKEEKLDLGHAFAIAEDESYRLPATGSIQAKTGLDRGESELEEVGLSSRSRGSTRRLQQSSVPQGVQTILVVSKDGLPNHFPTVQAAVDAVPMWNYANWIIYIKPGIYYGTVVVPQGKSHITFLGEDPAVTTLSCRRNAKDTPMGILDCPCVIVEASYFRAENIAFENTSPKPAKLDYDAQAPAIRISGDNSSFYGCYFLGWQDTLFADQGRHYYENCKVEGSVDFILGYARAVFKSCTIYSRSEGFITAQSRWCDLDCRSATSAFVFLNCTLTGSATTYLGRPWRKYAKVLYIDSWMGSHIVPQGWADWLDGERPLISHENVYFAEGNNHGPGAVPHARISWSHQIGEAEIVTNSYRDVRAFLDGETWLQKPPSLSEILNSDLMKSFSPFTTANDDDTEHDSRYPRRREKDLSSKLLD